MEKEKIYHAIQAYFKDRPVSKVYVFGSYATGNENQDSDLDILLELDHPVGLMQLSRFKNDLEDILKLRVDIGTTTGVSKYAAGEVRENASIIYKA